MRSVKQPLKKSLGRSTLNNEELHTILEEMECIVNARPITYVYDNEESVSYPLTPSFNKADISVGDVLIFKSHSTTRNFWKLAKVEELITGADGEVRCATVKVASSHGQPQRLKRVIQHLILLEAN